MHGNSMKWVLTVLFIGMVFLAGPTLSGGKAARAVAPLVLAQGEQAGSPAGTVPPGPQHRVQDPVKAEKGPGAKQGGQERVGAEKGGGSLGPGLKGFTPSEEIAAEQAVDFPADI